MYSGQSLMLINNNLVSSEPVNTLKKALNNLLHKSLCFIKYTEFDRNYLVTNKFFMQVKKIENDQTLIQGLCHTYSKSPILLLIII